jgi:SOS-response transcriptional repressor LexA
VALPGKPAQTAGVLLLDPESDHLYVKLRSDWDEFASEESDVLRLLEEDLKAKAEEMGGRGLIDYLQEHLTNIVRVTDSEIMQVGDFEARLRRLFRESTATHVKPFRTHLPFRNLVAAAGHLSEGQIAGEEQWIEVPEGVPVGPGMFLAEVRGRSMEPLIPDGSICVFREQVAGSRVGRKLLIERYDSGQDSGQFTVKVYRSEKTHFGEDAWEHRNIRLEPLNPEFEPWYLEPDQFRVIGEFVAVLPPEE